CLRRHYGRRIAAYGPLPPPPLGYRLPYLSPHCALLPPLDPPAASFPFNFLPLIDGNHRAAAAADSEAQDVEVDVQDIEAGGVEGPDHGAGGGEGDDDRSEEARREGSTRRRS
ncbi:unnamed protein product, partial [Musa textilis]